MWKKNNKSVVGFSSNKNISERQHKHCQMQNNFPFVRCFVRYHQCQSQKYRSIQNGTNIEKRMGWKDCRKCKQINMETSILIFASIKPICNCKQREKPNENWCRFWLKISSVKSKLDDLMVEEEERMRLTKKTIKSTNKTLHFRLNLNGIKYAGGKKHIRMKVNHWFSHYSM